MKTNQTSNVFSVERAIPFLQLLLKIGAVKLNLKEPFKWSSGWNSPIYCNNRKGYSHVDVRTMVKYNLAAIAKSFLPAQAKKEDLFIAGVANGATAWGALVADHLGIPYVYVLPEPKKHGAKTQIEGDLRLGMRGVVIEDLISTGKSSAKVVQVLKEAGYPVLGLGGLFDYGFAEADQAFAAVNCPRKVIADYDLLLQEAVRQNIFTEAELPVLQAWKENPAGWGVAVA